ncbi:MAG: hypothetical protein Q9169_005837 [Polycauliona sp. 2 TL-2023]
MSNLWNVSRIGRAQLLSARKRPMDVGETWCMAIGSEQPKKAQIYLKAVKNGPKEIGRLVEELEAFRSLLNDFEDLSRRLQTSPDGAAALSLRRPADLERLSSPLARSSEEIDELMTRLERARKPGGWKWRASTHALRWPFSQKEILTSLERLGRLRTILTASLAVDQWNLCLETHQGISAMSKQWSNTKNKDCLDSTYEWLSAPDPSQRHEEARQKRLSTTGSWFIKHPDYHKWRTAPNSLLWLHGMTGSGKTVLSSTVIENLSIHCQRDLRHTLAYFYFESSNTCGQHDILFLRSLLSQLSKCTEAGALKLNELYNSCDRGRAQPTYDALFTTLRSMLQNFVEAYIVIDALDECKERSKLLDLIQTINEWQFDGLHVLITSRRETDIRKVLGSLACAEMVFELAPSYINDDISKYIEDRLSTDRSLSRWRMRPEIQEKIRRELLYKGKRSWVAPWSLGGTIADELAQHRFRWVDCQLVILRDCINLPMLEEALVSLPSTIGASYELMLSNIKHEFKQTAIRAFRWLALSQQPLTIGQFVDILAIDVHKEPQFDPDCRMPDPADILTVCSSLITMVSPRRDEEYYVMLAHPSIQEYLLSDMILQGRASTYAVACPQCQATIAEACLYYLLSIVPTSPSKSTEYTEREQLRIKYPLVSYAARFWAEHAKKAGKNAEPLGSIFDKVFLSENFRVWFHFAYYVCLDGVAQETVEALRLPAAAEKGKLHLVQHLLQNGAEINGNVPNRTVLQIAARKKDVDLVRFLLEKGADPKLPALFEGRFALDYAAEEGCDEIVKLLLDHGADIDALPKPFKEDLPMTDLLDNLPPDGHICQGKSALDAAARMGHLSTVQLLLSRGAVMKEEGNHTSLVASACSRNVSIVQLFLSRGALVNAQGEGSVCFALHAAVIQGGPKNVELLIKAGANVNAHDHNDVTALHLACEGGQQAIAEILMDAGADIETVSYGHETPLEAASLALLGESHSLVRCLLHRGAKLDVSGHNLIEHLSKSNRTKASIIEILLRWGEGQDASSKIYREAFHNACQSGNEQLVQFLTEYGVKINTPSETGENSFHIAAAYGHNRIVEYLLATGTNINVQGGSWGNALEAALDNGQARMVQQLLEAGASPEVATEYKAQMEKVLSDTYVFIPKLPGATARLPKISWKTEHNDMRFNFWRRLKRWQYAWEANRDVFRFGRNEYYSDEPLRLERQPGAYLAGHRHLEATTRDNIPRTSQDARMRSIRTLDHMFFCC